MKTKTNFKDKTFLKLIIILIINISFPVNSRIARVFLVPDVVNSGVSGELNFVQDTINSTIKIKGKIYGAKKGNHAFAIHEGGNIDEGCLSTGAYFNPVKNSTAENRHIGDMGNLYSDGKIIDVNMEIKHLTLFGKETILGRTAVLHEKERDLKENEAGKLNGNSGVKISCGIGPYNVLIIL